MTAKEWLNKGRRLDAEVSQLQEARKKALELACGCSVDISNERIQASNGNAMERKFIAYADYAKLINDKIDELVDYRRNMIKLINMVDDDTYRTLLIARYMNCKTWERIAEDMGYDLRWIYRLHGRSLQAIESHYASVI